MKIGIVVGESSGDALGASLLTALRERYPDLEAYGVGGNAMQAQGFHSLFDMERLAVMGLIEPLKRLPDLMRLRRDLISTFEHYPPDVFIGIDAPEFNIGLELKLKRLGIKTIHYVSPSVWAWRQNRIHKIAKAVDLMLTLFPFEEAFYKQHHLPVKCVGHPLAEKIPLHPNVENARAELRLDNAKQYVALLPGSRQSELRYMAATYLQAAKKIQQTLPGVEFLTAHVNQDREADFMAIKDRVAPGITLHSFVGQSHAVMQAADAIVVTSGTATLEAMLYKKPMVIAYKLSAFTYAIAKIVVKIPYVGLPNILAGKEVVPELIQHMATPENIAEHIVSYLTNAELTNELQSTFCKLHQSLRQPTGEILSEAINELLEGSSATFA